MAGHDANHRVRVAPVRLRNMLWLPLLGALLGTIAFYGTPHLLFGYAYNDTASGRHYTKCSYIGWHSQIVFPHDGKCPLIRLLKQY